MNGISICNPLIPSQLELIDSANSGNTISFTLSDWEWFYFLVVERESDYTRQTSMMMPSMALLTANTHWIYGGSYIYNGGAQDLL